MATVTVEVNGRPYAVGCADGQEDRVRELARQFDARVRQLAGDVGQVGDLRLFLMAGLTLADALSEVETKPDAVSAPPAVPASAPSAAPASSDGVAEALNAVAARIEKLTQVL